MKKFLLLSLALIVSFFAYSQDFAPIGATWHYRYESDNYAGYIKIESLKDTLIENKNCRQLHTYGELYDIDYQSISNVNHGYDFVYNDDDKVYLYYYDQFYTLYDFSAEIGDSWVVPPSFSAGPHCDSDGTVKVVDKGDTIINNQSLRYFVFSDSIPEYTWYMNGMVIETIGAVENYFFAEQSCYLELGQGGTFRCYKDDSFDIHIGEEACTFIIGINELQSKAESIQISYSPKFIRFHSINNSLIQHLKIYDISGKKVFDKGIYNPYYQLHTSNYNSGIYIYEVQTDGKTEKGKLVIQ